MAPCTATRKSHVKAELLWLKRGRVTNLTRSPSRPSLRLLPGPHRLQWPVESHWCSNSTTAGWSTRLPSKITREPACTNWENSPWCIFKRCGLKEKCSVILWVSVFCLCVFLATSDGMWALSSPTRDRTHAPWIGSSVLTTGQPEKSLRFQFYSGTLLETIAQETASQKLWRDCSEEGGGDVSIYMISERE